MLKSTEKEFTLEDSTKDLIAYLLDMNGTYCFRGQSDAKWEITSSYSRLASKHIKDDLFKVFVKERRQWDALHALEGRVHLITDSITEDDNKYVKLSYLQHWGVPTNVVDFTTSPMVALYFSLSEEPECEKSAIYVIDYEVLRRINNEIKERMINEFEVEEREYLKKIKTLSELDDIYYRAFDDINEFLELHIPQKYNERLNIQKGLFLIPHNATCNIEELLNELYSFKEVCHQKIIYPSVWKNELYQYLCIHNISGEAIYPGIEGFATQIRQDLIFLQ